MFPAPTYLGFPIIKQLDWIFTTTPWCSFCGSLPLASFHICNPCMPQGLCLCNQFPLPGIPYGSGNCLLDLKAPPPKSLPCAPTPASFLSYSLPHVPTFISCGILTLLGMSAPLERASTAVFSKFLILKCLSDVWHIAGAQ